VVPKPAGIRAGLFPRRNHLGLQLVRGRRLCRHYGCAKPCERATDEDVAISHGSPPCGVISVYLESCVPSGRPVVGRGRGTRTGRQSLAAEAGARLPPASATLG